VGHDTIEAARTIKQILTSVEDHGIIDVWKRHDPKQIVTSIFALSRIQGACQHYDRENHYNDHSSNSDPLDDALLEDLLHCAPFATAAYGWKLDLATAGKLHRGDLQAIVKMTNIHPDDVVTVNWDSRPNRPVRILSQDKCNCIFRLYTYCSSFSKSFVFRLSTLHETGKGNESSWRSVGHGHPMTF
jgi:hypothetical protein